MSILPTVVPQASSPTTGAMRAAKSTALRPNLRASVWDAGYYGAMVGIGETFLPAFALAIGLGEVIAGLVASVPIFFGGVVQLISLRALAWTGSYKKWIIGGVLVQAIAFIPLVIAAIAGSISAWLFFVVASCYWGAGMAASPAWNTWIGHVVPLSIRPNFFARRTRVIQLATLGGFLLGGWLLQATRKMDIVLWGFAGLFVVAGLARFISAVYLYKHTLSEMADRVEPRHTTAWQAWSSISDRSRWLIVYLVCMQACVQFSGPYFVPYIIKQLHYDYASFCLVIAVALVSKALSMSMWGIVARRFGAGALLWIAGVGVVPLASLWVVSQSIGWVIVVQALSGVLWAGYELAFFLLFLQDIPQKYRADTLTIYNFANSAAWCLGALLGGWWIAFQGPSISAYHSVFLASSLARTVCLLLLIKLSQSKRGTLMKPREVSTSGRNLVFSAAKPLVDSSKVAAHGEVTADTKPMAPIALMNGQPANKSDFAAV